MLKPNALTLLSVILSRTMLVQTKCLDIIERYFVKDDACSNQMP